MCNWPPNFFSPVRVNIDDRRLLDLLCANMDESTSNTAAHQSPTLLQSTRQSPDGSGASSPFKTIYSTLPDANSIRLLRLHGHGTRKDHIHCTLEVHNLHDPCLTIFEALSYTWADSSGDSSLRQTICHGPNYDILPVTANCLAALRRFRTAEDRMLWVDAICINQFDFKERSQQVSIMGDIYMSAARVLTYLGDEGNGVNTTTGVNYINMKTYESRPECPPVDVHSIMRAIIEMPYFSRIWVIQEVLLNRRASLTLNDSTLRWVDFSAYFRHRHPEVENDLAASWVTYFGIEQNERSLSSLLIATKHCRCSDARDRVFGLMGLVSEKERDMLPVDYTISTQQLYTGLAAYCFMGGATWQTKSSILDLACLQKVTPFLPSWAPDWASLPNMNTNCQGISSSAFTFEMDTTDVAKRSSGLDWNQSFWWSERGQARCKFTLNDTPAPKNATAFRQENGVLVVYAIYLFSVSTSNGKVSYRGGKSRHSLKGVIWGPSESDGKRLPRRKLDLFYLPNWNRGYLLQHHARDIYSLVSSCEIVCAPSGTPVTTSHAVDASVIYTRLQSYEVEVVESWLMDIFVYGVRAGSAFAVSPRVSRIQHHSSKYAPMASSACQDLRPTCGAHVADASYQTIWAAMTEIRQNVMDFAVANEVPWHIPPCHRNLTTSVEHANLLFSDNINDAELSTRIQRAQVTESRTATSPQELIAQLRNVIEGHLDTCKRYKSLETALDDLSYLPFLWAPMGFEQVYPIYPLLDTFAEDEPEFKRRHSHVPLVLNHVINNAWTILQDLTIDPKFTLEQNFNILWIHVLTMEMVVRLRGILHQRLILDAMSSRINGLFSASQIYLI